jgi:DNA-binding NarL/FixJ family response regulator
MNFRILIKDDAGVAVAMPKSAPDIDALVIAIEALRFTEMPTVHAGALVHEAREERNRGILARLAAGETQTAIARSLGLAQATVSHIKRRAAAAEKAA